MRRLNIWVSTTLHHNYGDQVIELGVSQVLAKAFGTEYYNFNKIWYNRAYDLQILEEGRRPRPFTVGNYDNDGRMKYDLAVVAGSPEFFGPPMESFYQTVLDYDMPLIALGVGTTWDHLSLCELSRKVLSRKNTFVTARGPRARDIINRDLGQTKVVALPCPSIFAASHRAIPRLSVGAVAQTLGQDFTAVPESTHQGLDRADEILCVHKNDFYYFQRKGFSPRIFSSVGHMMQTIGQYKKIMSTRLHGALAAVSLGIPTVVVHDQNERIRDAMEMFEGLIPQVKNFEQAKKIKGSDPEKLDKFRWEKYAEQTELVKEFLRQEGLL